MTTYMNNNWNILQSAVQGTSHAEQGLPCQDKTASATLGDCRVIALADGAGSACLSHAGAECAVQTMCSYLSEEFDRLYSTPNAAAVRAEVMALLQSRLAALAAELDCRMSDLASTLLLAAVKGERYILLHLGDGLIAYRKNGILRPASLPTNGEYANTTTFTTSPPESAGMKLIKGELGAIDGFVLMSDGSYASLYNKAAAMPAPVLGWLMDLSSYLPPEEVELGLEESLAHDVRAMTTDDCSIAVLARRHYVPEGLAILSYPVLLRLTGLEYHAPESRRRLRVYLRILSALAEPAYLSNIVPAVHQKISHLLKKVSILMQLHLVKRLPDGRYLSLARFDTHRVGK